MNSTRKCWVAVNKNGFICMFVNEPTRNLELGKWEGEIYLDSLIYKTISSVICAKMTWENEAEFFEFSPK